MIYALINSVRFPVVRFSYRLSNVAADTKISHLLECIVATKVTTIAASDSLEFYEDDTLIYSDPINEVIKNQYRTTLRSSKEINIPVAKTVPVTDISYYSSSRLRSKLDFSIVPLDTISTFFGDFVAQKVVHYGLYTEVTYG